jgi:hypothetical protein
VKEAAKNLHADKSSDENSCVYQPMEHNFDSVY